MVFQPSTTGISLEYPHIINEHIKQFPGHFYTLNNGKHGNRKYPKRLLIEFRRLFSLFLLPWVIIALACFLTTWYSLFVLGIDVLLAPVLKLWFLLKSLLLHVLPAILFWAWTYTFAKVFTWLSELIALAVALFGGWKAWSFKKLARQTGRFILSASTRFIIVSVVLNLLFGHERKGVKSLPEFAMYRVQRSWAGRMMQRWLSMSDRQKRLVLGVILCLVLVLAGQAMLGISVLMFDLIWELVLLLARLIMKLWRLIGPFVLKLIPNFIGNFITNKVVPLVVNVIPVIRDDHRVLYLRLNSRRQWRRMKAWLYLKSRAHRQSVRGRLTTMINDSVRVRKTALLTAAAKLNKKKHTDNNME